MKKKLANESLIFICAISFGAVIIPTTFILILAIFGEMPRNESLVEGYDSLRALLRGNMWVFYFFVFGPYLLLQVLRFARWKWGFIKGHALDPFSEKTPPYIPPSTPGLECDSSMLSWRDGLDDFKMQKEVEEKKDD